MQTNKSQAVHEVERLDLSDNGVGSPGAFRIAKVRGLRFRIFPQEQLFIARSWLVLFLSF